MRLSTRRKRLAVTTAFEGFRRKRLATIALATSAMGGLLVFGAGCEGLESEGARSEREVNRVADEALAKEQKDARALYGEVATKVAGKSDAATARARQLEAETEFAAASRVLRDVTREEANLGIAASRVHNLISTIKTGSALAQGYQKFDAEPVRKEAASQVAAVTGSADAPLWVKTEGAQIPSLSSVKQTISKLEGEVSQRQEKVNNLTKERQQILAQAEELGRKSEQAKGKESVDLYKQASDLRKKAADVGNQIELVNAEIRPLQVDLGIAQAQRQIAEAAVGDIQKQAKETEQSFAQVQQQAKAHAEVTKNVYQAVPKAVPATQGGATAEGGVGTKSLEGQIEDLVKQAEKVATDRAAAAQLLDDAAKHYDEAQKAAEALRVALDSRASALTGDAPQKLAWEGLKQVYNPTLYQFEKGMVAQTTAMLRTQQVSSLKDLVRVQGAINSALKDAGLKAPQSVTDAKWGAELKEASAQAVEAATAAEELFRNVSEAPLATKEQQNAARGALVLTLYSRAQLERELGDAAKAKEHIAAAKDVVKLALENNATLPVLPPEIAPEPPKVVAATAPAAAAASQPAPSTLPGTPADPAVSAAVKQSLADAVGALAANPTPEQIKALVVAPAEMQPAVDTLVSIVDGGVKLQKAVVAKFGPEGMAALGGPGAGGAAGANVVMKVPTAEEIKAALEPVQVRTTGEDTIVLVVPGSNQPVPLKKNGDAWALDFGALVKEQPQMAAMLPMMTTMLKPMGEALTKTAADVEAGKYENVAQVKAALQEAMGPALGMMMGGMGPGGGAPGFAAGPATEPAATPPADAGTAAPADAATPAPAPAPAPQ